MIDNAPRATLKTALRRWGFNDQAFSVMDDEDMIAELTSIRANLITAAYAPEDCESCEVNEATCRECAVEALEENGFIA